jgi:hypothetical protein
MGANDKHEATYYKGEKDTMGIMDTILDGAAGRWFKFDRPGDTVSGEIASITERQTRNFDTKAPEFWDDGEPKIEVLFALRTSLPREDADDDGIRVVRVKGWGIQRNALREACQRLGRPPQAGDKLAATYSHDDRSKRGGFPAKAFTYVITEGTAPAPEPTPELPF